MDWTCVPKGFYMNVDGLGLVELYRDKGGFALDINGRRAYSGINGSERSIKLNIRSEMSQWKYLNAFSKLHAKHGGS